jgi:diketogulonate reductase-like aldo/keto reductase
MLQDLLFPPIGFGTYKLRNQDAINNALKHALSSGYKMIDTAEIYRNQKFIGNFLKENSVKRSDIWLTSKVSFASMKHSDNEVIKGINKTFMDLQVSYIDLYLIHAPIEERWIFTWNYLRGLQKENKIRYIGVSNFTVEKLIKFINLIGIDEAKYIYCNQIEHNPFLNRKDLIELCNKNNIFVTAYGSLYKSNDLIDSIAKKYNKTKEQILLKWSVQKNIRVIPMAENAQYIKDNISLDFKIADEDIDKMDQLNENYSQYKKYL